MDMWLLRGDGHSCRTPNMISQDLLHFVFLGLLELIFLNFHEHKQSAPYSVRLSAAWWGFLIHTFIKGEQNICVWYTSHPFLKISDAIQCKQCGTGKGSNALAVEAENQECILVLPITKYTSFGSSKTHFQLFFHIENMSGNPTSLLCCHDKNKASQTNVWMRSSQGTDARSGGLLDFSYFLLHCLPGSYIYIIHFSHSLPPCPHLFFWSFSSTQCLCCCLSLCHPLSLIWTIWPWIDARANCLWLYHKENTSPPPTAIKYQYFLLVTFLLLW